MPEISDCCQRPHTGTPPTCPMNGQVVKPIGRKTIESLVRPDLKKSLVPQPYYFCDAPDCDTVYVSAAPRSAGGMVEAAQKSSRSRW